MINDDLLQHHPNRIHPMIHPTRRRSPGSEAHAHANNPQMLDVAVTVECCKSLAVGCKLLHPCNVRCDASSSCGQNSCNWQLAAGEPFVVQANRQHTWLMKAEQSPRFGHLFSRQRNGIRNGNRNGTETEDWRLKTENGNGDRWTACEYAYVRWRHILNQKEGRTMQFSSVQFGWVAVELSCSYAAPRFFSLYSIINCDIRKGGWGKRGVTGTVHSEKNSIFIHFEIALTLRVKLSWNSDLCFILNLDVIFNWSSSFNHHA